MLRPERMEQVSIIIANDQLANFLTFAGKHKIFHQIEILEETLPQGATRFEAGELLAKASNIRNRTQTLLGGLELEGPSEKIEAPSNDPEALAKFLDEETSKQEKEFRELERSEEKVRGEIERASELSRFLSSLEALGVSLESLGTGGFLTALTGEAHSEVTPLLQRELDRVTYGNTIFAITKTTDETESFIAILPAAFQPDAKQVATTAGAKLSPPLTDLPPDPARAKQVLDGRVKEIRSEDENLKGRRNLLIEQNGPRVRALAILSTILEARTKALSNASTTESTMLLKGWVPADRLDILQQGAPEATAGLVTIHVEREPSFPHHREKHDEITHEHAGTRTEPPTLIRIPAWTKPLQSVIDNFGLPSYGETNPLPFMLFTFPVIFGLMFGDYGEGILFLALGLALLRAKRKKVKIFEIGQMFVNGAELIVMLGASMIIFGLIFGDFFGFESQKIFGIPALFNPTQGAFDNPPNISHLLLYMEFVLFFGVAHYLSGLGISAYNKIRAGHYREAFFGPISWAWLYVVFIYLAVRVVVSGYKFSTLLQEPIAIVLFIVPLALQGYWEGGLHAFEVFISAGSNTLSYLRIWALNLADFAIKFAFYSFGGIAGVIAGNLLVMILEGLIVFVQTLRLHWIEWFSKFYEGSGQPFAPYQEPLGWIVLR